MAEDQIVLDSVEIVPMEGQMARGAFLDVNDEFQHLANWFRTQAILSQRDSKSRTYVAILANSVIGYITVSMSTVESMPKEVNKTAFQYQAMKIGKLLVSPPHRDKGIGALLLKFSIDIALRLDELVGCRAIFVDANTNPHTIRFYENHGFTQVEETESETDTTLMLFKLR